MPTLVCARTLGLYPVQQSVISEKEKGERGEKWKGTEGGDFLVIHMFKHILKTKLTASNAYISPNNKVTHV